MKTAIKISNNNLKQAKNAKKDEFYTYLVECFTDEKLY